MFARMRAPAATASRRHRRCVRRPRRQRGPSAHRAHRRARALRRQRMPYRPRRPSRVRERNLRSQLAVSADGGRRHAQVPEVSRSSTRNVSRRPHARRRGALWVTAWEQKQDHPRAARRRVDWWRKDRCRAHDEGARPVRDGSLGRALLDDNHARILPNITSSPSAGGLAHGVIRFGQRHPDRRVPLRRSRAPLRYTGMVIAHPHASITRTLEAPP